MENKLRCGLLGERLGHSYSKQIHGVFAPYEYELYEASKDEAERMIRSGGFSGLNITIPYKELAFSLCDETDDFARRAKSVNTVVTKNGKICGYNTDVFGFITMVTRAKISLSGKNILILGSGGTSKTARTAAEELGAKRISIVSRTGEINYDNVYSLSDTEIIINTTPVGMYPNTEESPIDISRFPRCEGVVDVIYNPAKTRLLSEAQALGIPCVNGLVMLAAQGFRAAEIFTGKSLSESLIDEAVKSVWKSVTNIVLIGMPGSGKTTIAKLLAKQFGRKLCDTDEIIREKYGAPADIITEKGESFFRDIETEVIRELSRERGIVISTGGGVVERGENRPLLSQNGRIYLISRDIAKLATENRPLSQDVFSLYEKRRTKYTSFADVLIDNNGEISAATDAIFNDFNR